jgi:hypothetical protein
MLWHRGTRGRFGPQRLFPPVAHIMKDDIVPNFSEDLIWRGLEAAEQYIPFDDLKLALEHDLQWSRFILHRLGQVCSVPRERDCQIHMLRHMIAEARNRL